MNCDANISYATPKGVVTHRLRTATLKTNGISKGKSKQDIRCPGTSPLLPSKPCQIFTQLPYINYMSTLRKEGNLGLVMVCSGLCCLSLRTSVLDSLQ